MINEFLDNVTQRIHDFFQGFVDLAYLGGWFTVIGGIAVAALAATWFFGGLPIIGNWIRAIAGGVVLLGWFFLWGMVTMFRHNREERDELRAKIRELQQASKRPGSGGWFWQ